MSCMSATDKKRTVDDAVFDAVKANKPDILKYLLKLKDVTYFAFYVEYAERNTLLHYACQHQLKEIVEILLEEISNKISSSTILWEDYINARNKNGWTALHWASLHGNTEIVALLLDKGDRKVGYKSADVNIVGIGVNGHTPLDLACGQGYENIVAMLLRHGANPNSLNCWGDAPLHDACRRGYKNIVAMLLAYGADVNIKNGHGDTPLHCAGSEKHKEIIELLMDKNADVTIKNNSKWTPLDYPTKYGWTDIITLFDVCIKKQQKKKKDDDILRLKEIVIVLNNYIEKEETDKNSEIGQVEQIDESLKKKLEEIVHLLHNSHEPKK